MSTSLVRHGLSRPELLHLPPHRRRDAVRTRPGSRNPPLRCHAFQTRRFPRSSSRTGRSALQAPAAPLRPPPASTHHLFAGAPLPPGRRTRIMPEVQCGRACRSSAVGTDPLSPRVFPDLSTRSLRSRGPSPPFTDPAVVPPRPRRVAKPGDGPFDIRPFRRIRRARQRRSRRPTSCSRLRP